MSTLIQKHNITGWRLWLFEASAVAFFLIPGSTVLLLLASAIGLVLRKTGHVRALAIAFALLSAIPLQAADWELVRKDPDLALYEKEMPGSDIVAFKFDGELNAPIDKVAAVILDYRRTPEWVDHLEESLLLRQVSSTEFVEYTHIGTPFVMKDRDFVLRVKVEFSRLERKLMITNESTEDPSAPAHGYVRGNVVGSTFVLSAIDAGHTRLSGEINADPMGSVPKWIVNLFQKEWPRSTFDHIQAQLKKSDLGAPEHFAPLIADLHALLGDSLPIQAIQTER